MLIKTVFSDFVRLSRGFDLPDSEIVSGEYPVIASTNIKAYHHKYKVEPPVVVTGRSGSLGKVQYITEKCWPLNTALYSKDLRNNNAHYIYYYLQIMHLEQYNAGAGVPTLNQNHLQRLKIWVHPKDEQDRVVAFLSAFDNLVKINNDRIKVLEQMAENLFKEWFVRFRFPGHETAEFENGIPKDWEIRKCSEIALIKAGGDRPDVFSKEYNEENPIPIYSNGIDNDGLYGYTNTPEITNESITISARGTVGFVCLRRKPYVPIVRLISVEPNLNMVTPVYLYYFFRRDTVMGNGTSQQQITIPMVSKKRVLLPPIKLVQLFSIKVNTFFDQIDCLKKKNHNLFKQRDLLLPRLMSGKLEV